MPDESTKASVEHLREAAAARVENTSLRGVAREIGMSPTGLKKFLQGTAPYSPTLRRLRNWYVQYAALPVGSVGKEDAAAALRVLTHDLAPSVRQDVMEEVVGCVATGYDESGKPRPRWLGVVAEGF